MPSIWTMKQTAASYPAALAAMSALPSLGEDAAARLAATKKWFVEAQYGMMVHWGLYSLLGGEWKGRTMEKPYHIAEWAQQYFRIPNAEYAKLAKAFNPVCFDADEWVQVARDAGMKYIVVTSKHHDGFAMFRSKVSPFNIVDATPFGRDPIEELAEACRRHGLKLGLYYSQDLDWHEKDGGGEQMGKTWAAGLPTGRTTGISRIRRKRTFRAISRGRRFRRSRRSSPNTGTSASSGSTSATR